MYIVYVSAADSVSNISVLWLFRMTCNVFPLFSQNMNGPEMCTKVALIIHLKIHLA